MKILKYNIKIIVVLIIALIFPISFQQTKLLAQAVSFDEVTWMADKGQNYNTDTGTVINEYYDGLELTSKDGTFVMKIKYDQIKNPIKDWIKYEQGGSVKGREIANDLRKVNDAQEKGDFKQAIDLCNKIIAAPQLRTVFKQSAMYNLAFSYQSINQFDKAIQTYDELIETFPDGRYIREAFINKSECVLRVKSLQEASDVLEQAKTELSKLRNMKPKFILELDLRKAIMFENNAKVDIAKSIYNSLISKAGSEPSILARAMVGKGCIDLKNNNYSEAERAFTKVIDMKKNDDVLSVAAAYNGRADCTLATTPSLTPEIYTKALFDYLHSKLLYPAPEGESTIEEENATYNAGLCWDKLAQSSPDQKKKQYFNNNAKGLYEELVQRFPFSKLVLLAQKRLNELSK